MNARYGVSVAEKRGNVTGEIEVFFLCVLGAETIGDDAI